jgi:nicotinate dehydrogenase subunit B
MSALNRRQFGQAAGALVLSFAFAPRFLSAAPAKLPGSLDKNRMLDAWLRINADGLATIFAGKVELGQGILTALAQIAAEELDLPLARVAMISGDTAQTPDEEYTSGSQSIEYGGTAVRLACAEARALLLERAAARLSVPVERLTVAEGTIRGSDGRRLGYGELAAELDLHREVKATVPPKPASSHRIVGTSALRRDIPAKVTGGIAYVQDLRLPGMVHGRVVRPPRYGARLEGVDAAQAGAMPGVIAVVRDGSFLGVIAAREEQAIRARQSLLESARWSGGADLPDPAGLAAHLTSLPSQDAVVSSKQAGGSAGVHTLEATYTNPISPTLRSVPRAPSPPSRTASSRYGRIRRACFRSGAISPRRCGSTRRWCAASTAKAPAATATMAPTTWRSTPRCWRARSRAARCACSGCATTSLPGSPTAPPW